MQLKLLCALFAAVLIVGCASSPPPKTAAKPRSAEAFALLVPTPGNGANGMVRFTQEGDRLLVMADVHNLAPGSVHGFHLHATGDCSGPDASGAGGHFNPDGAPHGPQGSVHHAGDMPSLKADDNGVARATLVLRGLTVSAGPHSIVGKALIVHRDADDYTTQPAGNSGARIACGVVALR
ncbi:MAG: superoxide dismutase family protein [Casimicrobiaceae bacterium]